ncbi:NUDIX domain-containing protein [Deinococcus sp. SM5_A1]|uniref:NUDIX domain-containing protein n=1 Tax=Deinococcus sp. SM5_A1 TaxID=3379094 RepID=UPI0038598CAE
MAILKEGKVLLIRRGDNGLWDVPGGGLESGEMPEAAARRELSEETSLSVGALRPLAVFQHSYTYPDGNVVDWTTHVFTAAYSSGEAQAGDDAHEARWWPLQALPQAISETTISYFAALRQPPPLLQHAGN